MENLLLSQVNEDRWLPSSYPLAVLVEDESMMPCAITMDGTSDQVKRFMRAHEGEREVWANPRLSGAAKFLYSIVNMFRSSGEIVPKPGWFVSEIQYTPASIVSAAAELRGEGLLKAGEFE